MPSINRKTVRLIHGIAIPACAMLFSAFSGCVTVAQDNPSGPAISGPYAAPADANAQQWPLRMDTPQGQVTVYQPQLTKFEGDKLTARAAVSVIAPGQQEPTFGAIWMDSRVATDRAAGTVRILDVTVTRARFPDTPGITEEALTAALRGALPQQPMTLSLDQLTSMLEVINKEKAAVKELATDPPKILFRDHPAVLVQFDGEPRLTQEPNSNILRAVNTPFFVALEPSTKTYYLKGAGQWFAAPDALGPYQGTGQVPQPVSAAADADGYKDPAEPAAGQQSGVLEIVTATDPTELIWTDGEEEMSPISDTDLLYVTNTDSSVFLQIQTQQIFVLLSGRWYSSPSKNGPWTYVPPDKLPADFARIPANSDKGDVLANVAGTQAAKDAVADTFVPQTAAIDRNSFEQPTVTYDGDANFQPIEGTACSYAVNSPNSVLLVSGQYYCCSNAVWYVSHSPRGHWDLCTAVPTEIYTIPPSCPVYSCRYVYVYDSTPQYVYCGYTPGYVGCYPYNGVVVYGTGYRYQPWAGHTYYPRPYTYGFAPHYDARENRWGFGVGFAAGGGDAWFGDHDQRGRRNVWFGHGGYRPAEYRGNTNVNIHQTVINRTVVHNEDVNVYERRKDIRRDIPTARPSVKPVEHARDEGHVEAHGPAAKPVDNRNGSSRDNVFVDPGGNVYRKTLNGWEQRQNNTWVPRDNKPGQPANGGNKGDNAHQEAPNQPHTEPNAPKHEPAPPRHEAPQENPKPLTPTEPRQVDHGKVTPKETPRDQTPAPAREPQRSGNAGHPAESPSPDLNQEYRARVNGEQRARSAPREPASTPPPARTPAPSRAPAQEPARNTSGNSGASHGNSGPANNDGTAGHDANGGGGGPAGNPSHNTGGGKHQ